MKQTLKSQTHLLHEEYSEAITRNPFVVNLPTLTTNGTIKALNEWYEKHNINKESRKHPILPLTVHMFETKEDATMFKLSFRGEYIDHLY